MRTSVVAGALVGGLLLSACASSGDDPSRPAPRAPAPTVAAPAGQSEPSSRNTPVSTSTPSTVAISPPTTTAPSTSTTAATVPLAVVTIRYRIERHVDDEPTAEFESVVEATLTDPRGWGRAGFAFERGEGDAPYRIVLAEGPEVDALCLPYDTYGKYSCQNGPVVALNADRWRAATPKWTGDLDDYRRMLVDHEVGHLLGMKHPEPQCPAPGRPAPIMNQQSTELDGCLPNPWPLDDEVAIAARHDRKLAPGPGE